MPSTVIRRFDYRPESHELLIEFVTGRVYVYCDVPESTVQALLASGAKGRYFNAHIRDRYQFRELKDAG